MEVLLDTCGRRRVAPLLIMYLLVVKAAADCPKPQGRGHFILSNEALLMNDFPEASVVTLECANGYIVESGSATIACIEGKWSEPDLICKKKDCGPPRPQPNMSFNISAGTLFGASIRVVCDKGYQVSGSSFKQCFAAGWSGRAKCEIVTCDRPYEVTNGRSSWDSQDDPKYGEIIQYVCNEGHTLVGNDSIMCNELGEFDSSPPECRGVTTEDIITPTSTPPAQETSTSTDLSATPTAHRAKTVKANPTPAASPAVQGGRNTLTTEDKAPATTVTAATSFQDEDYGVVDTNKDIGYVPVIVSVVCISIGTCLLLLFLHKFLLKRKGSYDTREDRKLELIQCQNL